MIVTGCYSRVPLQKTAAEEDTPVVVVQLAYGGGAAWGVSPDAAVAAGGDEKDGELSWKAFREEVR